MGVGATSGFDVWFQEFVFYAGPIIQLLFWLAMIVAAFWAVMLFKRLVDFQTGSRTAAVDEPVALDSEPATKAEKPAKPAIDVEEFVE